ncbi:MAG: hypothetical protein ACI835_004961 [Planctomycetota bacterium]|jgi:hypothetical protein
MNLLGVDDGELTPDGRYVVVRDNTANTQAKIFDAATGAELHMYSGGGTMSGAAQDSVGVTNERAIVIGSSCMIMDLTNIGSALLLSSEIGLQPRDLEITPDGTMAAVRGGSGLNGGIYVYDLNTGTEIAHANGEPRPWSVGTAEFDVDSVGATNDHAAFVSEVTASHTRVTIMDLHPAGGLPPAVVFETNSFNDLWGQPHDIAITPDGLHAVVRAELSIGLYRLDGANTHQVWAKRLWGNPGPMGGASMDSVEVSNDRIVTISRWSNGGVGAQVDVFDMAGNQWFQQIEGDPHDLAITPNGERSLVRTHTHVFMYDLVNLPGGVDLTYMSRQSLLSTHTSFGAGLDSVIVTNEKAVTVARSNETAKIRFWDISGSELVQTGNAPMPERPTDLVFTPSTNKVIITGWSRVMIFDMITNERLMNHDVFVSGGYPWCDGVVANEDTAIAFGYSFNQPPAAQGGWLTVIDLFNQPQPYCTANTNSTGAEAGIYATGSASVTDNNLRLAATDVPAAQMGGFLYGDTQVNTPFGNGIQCVGGQSWYFGAQLTSDAGMAERVLDNMNLPAGGAAITAGSTWNFQFVFRDPDAGAAGLNMSNGLEILFEL